MKGINLGIKNGNYTSGITKKLQTFIDNHNECKICKSYTNLHLHHLDANHNNNKIDNLAMLCSKCHNNIHQRGYNFHKTEWSILVSETFTSIQGELDTTGYPAHFIRLFGCNLNCKWCDSNYSKSGTAYKKYNYTDIIKLLKNWQNTKIDRIVITGGEPFVQNIVPLLLLSKLFGFIVEIETNGILPDRNGNTETLKQRIYHPSLIDKFNISPKLKGTQIIPKDKAYVRTLQTWGLSQFLEFNYNFKFVVSHKKDITQIKRIQNQLSLPNSKIWLMPEGATKEEQLSKMDKIVKLCLKHNYKFCQRLHVLIWGDKKGV